MAEYGKLSDLELNGILCDMIEVAEAAGEIITGIYNGEDFSVESKPDGSPVTAADKASDLYIRSELEKRYPDYAVVSEESGGAPSDDGQPFFLVDPLDGTSGFIRRDGEFAVNIALCGSGEILAGVVRIPVKEETYYAGLGLGAYVRRKKRLKSIRVSKRKNRLRMLIGRAQDVSAEKRIAEENAKRIAKTEYLGCSLKACRIALGKADICYHFGKTMEWDTAAAGLIVEEAGGLFRAIGGGEIRYGKPGFENDTGYILANREESFLG